MFGKHRGTGDSKAESPIPEIIKSEIRAAPKQMKNRKSPGEDKITCDVFRMDEYIIEEVLKVLLDQCLDDGKIPEVWQNAEVIIS